MIERNCDREMKLIQMMEEAEAAEAADGSAKKKKETNPVMLDDLVFVLVVRT